MVGADGGGPGITRVLCGVRTGVDGNVIIIDSLVGVTGGVGTMILSERGAPETSGCCVWTLLDVWAPSIFARG